MLSFFEFRQNFLPWLLLAAGLLVLLFFCCDLRLKLRCYRVVTPKIKTPCRLLVLSDLHSSSFGKNQTKLLQMVEETEPDFILFPGDTVDDQRPREPAFYLLEQLAQDYPCLLVTGNHEYRTYHMDALKRDISGLGVMVLANQSAGSDRIAVHGLEDPEGVEELFAQRLEQLAQNIKDDKFNILLTHRPERFEEYIPYGFDLILCGHTHGGQWRLPGVVEGLFATGQGLFPSYAGGSYEKNGCRMIISRGLSKKHIWIPRIFNRPEVVLVQMLPSNN